MGFDFRFAYLPGVTLNGAGQAIALVEFDGYYQNDITAYENQTGLPHVILTNVFVDGFDGIPITDNTEMSLDIEMAISMAPGLSKVIVYEAPSGGSTAIDVLNQIATDNSAKQISCSWVFGDSTNLDQIYKQYATQGQSFFQSSGDDGAFSLLWPNQQQADSPYVTLVGGTTLTTTGPEGDWLTEKVWNWNIGNLPGETNGASGGGLSQGEVTYPIPSWQQGIDMTLNQGSTIVRNVPDVAMVADGIYVIYNNGSTESIGGTSCAAPLWAGFIALVNQQAEANGQPTVGFINPAIYAIGTGTTYEACFHDIMIGDNETYYSPFQYFAVSGYNLCTGWGTPNGSNLVNALAPMPASDLTRDSDSLDDSSPPVGGTVTVSITIINEACPGGGSAAGPFHIGFYWSTDSGFSSDPAFYEKPVGGCIDGGSVSITQNITIDPTTSPGTHYLGYKIDDSNEVTECNENDKGIFYWTVTVLPASVCTVTVSPSSVELPAKGGSKTVKVKSFGTGCDWTAASNDSFITITEGASGAGNGTVRYAVLGNTNAVPLTGTITIAGQTVIINQAAGGCTYSLSPKSAKFTAIGGSKVIKVKPKLNDCIWTAISDNPFIMITGAATGVGSGAVSFSVAANTNSAPLTGTITIGDETFTISEAAAP